MLASLLVAAPFVALGPAAAQAVEPRPWPHEVAGLPPHPDVRFGALDNGVRYAVRAFDDPAEHVDVWLHVAAGSAVEREGERGMAHFVEHMGLRGTARYRDGALIDWAQQNGLGFGRHLNGFTSYADTTYVLALPRNDERLLRQALEVLRDYAAGMRFEPDAVALERGVVDAEERERDAAEQRAQLALWSWMVAGTRMAERDPLGVASERARFDAEALVAFHARWYVPQNLTVVVVGDLPRGAVRLLRDVFGRLGADAPAPPVPELGEPSLSPRTLVWSDPRLHDDVLRLQSVAAARYRPRDLDELRALQPLAVARKIVDERMSALAETAPSVRSASLARLEPGPALPLAGLELTVRAAPGLWREALAEVEQELRRALRFGFDESEVARARDLLLLELRQQVEHDATRRSESKARWLLAAAGGHQTDHAPAALRDALGPRIAAVTAEEAQAALALAWEGATLRLACVGPTDLGAQPDEALWRAYEASASAAVERRAAPAVRAFAYASAPDRAGHVVRREDDVAWALTTVDFANGVRVHVRPQSPARVEVRAIVAGGYRTLPAKAWFLGWVAEWLFTSFGIGEQGREAWQRAIAGRDVTLRFSVEHDSFRLGGNTTRGELLLQCELICAHLTDLAWRAETFDETRATYGGTWDAMMRDPQRVLSVRFGEELGHPHSTPAPQEMDELELDALRAWLDPQLRGAPLEVVIWGGVDVEETIAVAARTFGALPQRWPRAASTLGEIPPPRPGLRCEYEVPDATNALIRVVYPTDDGLEPLRRYRAKLLEAVLEDRIRSRLREELGLVYAPHVGSSSSEVFEGVGMLHVTVACAPELAERVVALCLEVGETLARDGIGRDELERLRNPVLEAHDDEYWIDVLSRLARDEDALEDWRRGRDVLWRTRPGRLGALATQWLTAENASIAIARPAR